MNKEQEEARLLTEVEALLTKLPTLWFVRKPRTSTFLVYRRNMRGVITVRHSAKALRNFLRRQLAAQ